MLNKSKNRKPAFKLTLLFMMLYFISYITRINYGAVISEIVKSEGILKSKASLALTASAVTYGIGQLISGFLGDRFNPKKLILSGLVITALTNLLLPFCRSAYQMTFVWAVNGLAQSFMWPPMVRLMSEFFTKEEYSTACTYVSCSAQAATMAVYVMSPVFIYLAGWKSVFFVSAFFALIMIAVWEKTCPQINKKVKKDEMTNKENSKMPGAVVIYTVILLTAIAFQGIIRDGVTTWMPSYVSETFGLDNKIAILTGVVIPVFSIIVTQLTSIVYVRFIRNEMLLAGVIFALGFVISMAMYALNGVSPVISIVLSALFTGCTHGVNWIVTCMMPPKFGKYGKISFMSGLLNASVYAGSAVSIYGVAAFSESMGWSMTLLLWSGIALAASLLFFILSAKKL
ncbi:MAG: MFS transporter [Clostridia bacterium]|nr:MFS transporter [Clostridia bacterium]